MDDRVYLAAPKRPDMITSTSDPSSSPLGLPGWLTLLAVVVGCFAVNFGGSLIDPVPSIFVVEGAAVGSFMGIALIYFAPPFEAIAMYLLVPASFCFAGAAITEPLIKFMAFHNSRPQDADVTAQIAGPWIQHGKHASYCVGVSVQPFPGSRLVNIRTDRAICSQVMEAGPAGPGCLLIDVQTGRYGLRRVYAPLFTYYGSDRLRSCLR